MPDSQTGVWLLNYTAAEYLLAAVTSELAAPGLDGQLRWPSETALCSCPRRTAAPAAAGQSFIHAAFEYRPRPPSMRAERALMDRRIRIALSSV